MRRRHSNRFLAGFVLIGLGALFLGQQLGYTSLNIGELLSRYWPVFIIYVGLAGFLRQRERSWGGSYIWNVFIMLAGLMLLAKNLDFLGDISYAEMFKFTGPAALILIGLGMLARPGHRGKYHDYRYNGHHPGGRPDGPWPEYKQSSKGHPPHPPHPPHRKHDHSDDRGYGPGYGYDYQNPGIPHPDELSGNPKPDDADVRQEERKDWREQPQGEQRENRKDWHEQPRGEQRENRKDWREQPREEQRENRKDWREQPRGEQREHREDRREERRRERWEQRRERWEQRRGRWDQRREKWDQKGEHYEQFFHDRASNWGGRENHSSFFGDVHLGHDFWELKPMNISHFIGDTILDLTRAQIPCGETKVNISAFIGDVKVFIPNDMPVEISVVSSSFLGDIRVFERHESGFMRNISLESPHYADSEKKIKLIVGMFIGDVRVQRVG